MKLSPNSFTLKDFSNLDDSEHSKFLIDSMHAHYTAPSMIQIKEEALNILNLKEGESVCEIGCGLGYDAAKMAAIVGKTGNVTAIDKSQKILFEAQKINNLPNLKFYQYDAAKLPFANNTFDVCRADRLLVSQKNVSTVLSEMVRILKPGGRLCITDLDFGSMILAPYISTVDKIIKYWQNLVENPYVGRQLPALFKDLNLSINQPISNAFHVSSYKMLQKIVPFDIMLNNMVNIKLVSKQQKADSIEAFEKTDREGTFFWSINLVTMMGYTN
ncbi:MAG: hypothetical protein CMF49_03625 [Legionellales bacterium]|nr:hypothetical protein [Legionellales bacterium]